ncbi:HAMP domain-containing sensor histidine kinase [Streptomyces cheonanensis]|uniref:histidine kinase n=1 Tax=Streptomyces cheonanensis TaxID=312720 RepID=A0ABN2USD8_9ACTN|nr:HAMP domain-containing sensor histidine kinase [Streptomyces harbinensis]QKV68647.1 HAMP domain-containing histidine kinase [Streptomyces harbinensis]
MRGNERRGLSARWKLTLSYAGFLMVAGALLLAVVWVFLLRYVPDTTINTSGGFVPNRSDLLDAFVPPTVIALFALLVLGLAGGWLLAGRMLSPLASITEATRLAGAGSLSHRVRMDDRRDEFGELADAFDAMLTKVESHVAEQQRFAANASHELRTPLAIMRTVIDVARKDPGRDTTADLARLKATNDRAIALTEALLVLSRAGNTIAQPEVIDLSLLADEAVDTLLSLAEQQSVLLRIDGSVAHTAGSPTLLLQMMTNLIHNAIVHNQSQEARVWVRTSPAHGRAIVTVENTGAHVPADRLARFTEPFLKGTGRAHLDHHAGNGLGLSIVEKIVEAHGGTLRLTPRNGGGITVRVELPEAIAPAH